MKAKHLIEAWLAAMFATAFRILPLDTASAVGGFIARAIGPYLKAHTIGDENLKLIYPKMSFSERHRILMAMWDNLGRVAAELPHMGDELCSRVEITGKENVPAPGTPVVFFSGHIGNWELLYATAFRLGLTTTLIYRQANNPYVEKMISDIRAKETTHMFAKGKRGSVKMLRVIKDGTALMMLSDQKMNEGLPIPFFGYDAMTATTIAEFALRFNLPLIPARVIRKKGCHFEVQALPALAYEKTGDHDKDVRTILTLINAQLESWVREHPEQWFWVHRRWPKEPQKSKIED